MACHIARKAYELACESLDAVPVDQRDDAVRVLQLIRDNLSKWTLILASSPGNDSDEESEVDVAEVQQA